MNTQQQVKPFQKGDKVKAVREIGDFGEIVPIGTEGVVELVGKNLVHVRFPLDGCWGVDFEAVELV